MQKPQSIQKPILSRRAFWDIRLEELDFDRYAKFTIIRVFERGSTNDVREIIRYYGRARIIKTILLAEQLMPRAFVLSKRLFHLSNDQYKCLEGTPRVMNFSMF